MKIQSDTKREVLSAQSGKDVGENPRIIKGRRYLLLGERTRSVGDGCVIEKQLIEVNARSDRRPFWTPWFREVAS